MVVDPEQNFWEIRVYININIFIYKQSKRTNWRKIVSPAWD